MPASKKTSSKKVVPEKMVESPKTDTVEMVETPTPEVQEAPEEPKAPVVKPVVLKAIPTPRYTVISTVKHDGVVLNVGDEVTDPDTIKVLEPLGLLTKL